ncbi:MAG: hypothetical protein QM278_07625 [Pseudomonadota bacterium]|nr:hypothetical protein [Pseudomonadota bacterium]
MMGRVEFLEDLPFPEANIAIYRNIYYVEQWLRRILITALFAKHGEKWPDSIPNEILSELKKRRGSLKGRIFFDTENNPNVLWLSTFEELRKICLNPELWPFIKKNTAFTETEFTEKLNFLREIRNIIGHNRAATEQTQKICEGLVTFFRRGIYVFKRKMGLVSGGEETQDKIEKELSYQDTEEFRDLEGYLYRQDHPEGSQIFLWETEHFRTITTLPIAREYSWIDIAGILEEFRELDPYILTISINFTGDEYSVIWPKLIPTERQYEIIRKFTSSEPKHWTEIPFEGQSPRFLGDPKIWFYKEDTFPEVVEEPEGDNIIPFPKKT